MGRHLGTLEEQASRLATRTARRWDEETEDRHRLTATWDLQQMAQMGDLHLREACGNLSHATHLVKAMQLHRNKLSNMLG